MGKNNSKNINNNNNSKKDDQNNILNQNNNGTIIRTTTTTRHPQTKKKSTPTTQLSIDRSSDLKAHTSNIRSSSSRSQLNKIISDHQIPTTSSTSTTTTISSSDSNHNTISPSSHQTRSRLLNRPTTWFGLPNNRTPSQTHTHRTSLTQDPPPTISEPTTSITPTQHSNHPTDPITNLNSSLRTPNSVSVPEDQKSLTKMSDSGNPPPSSSRLSRWYPSMITSPTPQPSLTITTATSTAPSSDPKLPNSDPKLMTTSNEPENLSPDQSSGSLVEEPEISPSLNPPPPSSWWGWRSSNDQARLNETGRSRTSEIETGKIVGVINESNLDLKSSTSTDDPPNPNDQIKSDPKNSNHEIESHNPTDQINTSGSDPNRPYISRVGSWVYSWYDPLNPNTNSLTTSENQLTETSSPSPSAIQDPGPSEDRTNPIERTNQDLIPNPIIRSIPRESRGWAGMFSSRRIIPGRDVDEERKSVETMEIGTTNDDEPPPQSMTLNNPGGVEDATVSGLSGSMFSRIPSLRGVTSRTRIMNDKVVGDRQSQTEIVNDRVTVQESEPPKSTIHEPLTDRPIRNLNRNGKNRATIPNLVLPTFEDTFMSLPRSLPLKPRKKNEKLKQTIDLVQSYIFSTVPSESPKDGTRSDQDHERIHELLDHNQHPCTRLPKHLSLLGIEPIQRLRTVRKFSIIGVHGWFPNSRMLESVIGSRRSTMGTSEKLVRMMDQSLRHYLEVQLQDEFGIGLNQEFINLINLEADGTVDERVNLHFDELMKNWEDTLVRSDVIFVIGHSQGCVVSCKLVERLIRRKVIASGEKVMLMGMCGIWCGPFVGFNNSYGFQPVLKLLEGPAAHELFEFQDPRSRASQSVFTSLKFGLSTGMKVLLVGSMNDQVVPLYSSLYNSISHPSILRSIFIDSEVYYSTDFLTNLITFCQRLKNAGLSDHGLQNHLSEALIGSLGGVGHSSVYEDRDVFDLAVRYFFETSSPLESPTWNERDSNPNLNRSNGRRTETDRPTTNTNGKRLPNEMIGFDRSFSPRERQNGYHLPWCLRGMIDDRLIGMIFGKELKKLRDEFSEWRPVTKGLKELKVRMEPLEVDPTIGMGSKDWTEVEEGGEE